MEWPSVDFSFNVAQLFSPLLLVVVGWLINHAKVVITRHMDENRDKAHALAEERERKRQEIEDARHAENTARLDRIELQTTKTNGTVLENTRDIAELKSDMKTEKAKTELLTELLLKSQPDKGA